MRTTVKILIIVNVIAFFVLFLRTSEVYDLRDFHVDSERAVAVEPMDLAKIRSTIEMQNQIHKETVDLCLFYSSGSILLSLFNVVLLIVDLRRQRAVSVGDAGPERQKLTGLADRTIGKK